MKYRVHSSVIIIPSELYKLFFEILNDPDYSLNHIDIEKMTSEDGFTYFMVCNSLDDFQDLENALDDNWFPFNYYPSDLDYDVIFNRFNEKGMFIGTTVNYTTFLEIKLYGEKSRYSQLYIDKIDLEHSWENQVDNCLTSRLLNLL